MIAPIQLASIRAEMAAQPRDHINKDKTGEYAEAMMNGDQFPPLVVFFDGQDYWLADGFHRLHAAVGCGFPEYDCEIHEGSRRDAILFSVGANATHGYPRSNEDKRRSVRRLLLDREWARWSDREIARRCRVDHRFVGKLREAMNPADTGDIPSMERVFIHPRTGEESVMQTAGINANREMSPLVDLPLKSQEEIDAQSVLDFRNDFNSNAYIASRMWDIERCIQALPSPADAAAKFPDALLHSFSPDRARALAAWLSAFANAFEDRKEHLDAAE